MGLSFNEAFDKLFRYYQAYYNITEYDESLLPLVAFCEFYEKSQKYVLSPKAELWSENSEEFIYLYQVPHLTASLFEELKVKTYEDGMTKLHIGPGHMCSVINPVIICDTCDADAIKAIRKCRIYKSFHFSLHGWMDFRVAAIILSEDRIERNASGRLTAKILKKVLFNKK